MRREELDDVDGQGFFWAFFVFSKKQGKVVHFLIEKKVSAKD